jgi:hypothetical protein
MTNIKEQHEQDSTIWLMQQRSTERERERERERETHTHTHTETQRQRQRHIRPFGIRGSTVCTNSIVWLSQQLLQLAHCGCLKSPKSIKDLTPFCTHLVTCNVVLSCLQQFHLTHLWFCFETDPSKNTF